MKFKKVGVSIYGIELYCEADKDSDIVKNKIVVLLEKKDSKEVKNPFEKFFNTKL